MNFEIVFNSIENEYDNICSSINSFITLLPLLIINLMKK